MILEYYLENFNNLPPRKRAHFATRLKNWADLGFIKLPPSTRKIFDDFLAECYSEIASLKQLYENNDFSNVNLYEKRKPFFEEYDHLFAIESMLYHVHSMRTQYDTDITSEFLKIVPEEKIKSLCKELLTDPKAFCWLSSYAINVISFTNQYITEIDPNFCHLTAPFIIIAYTCQNSDYPTSLFIYSITHAIICDSAFYTRPIPKEHIEPFHKVLKACEDFIISDLKIRAGGAKDPDSKPKLSLDVMLEFLVCCRLTGYETSLKRSIKSLCHPTSKPFLTDPLALPAKNTLAGAEHRNVLFIMAGLDH